MPTAPKSQSPKRSGTGAPKAKGAVRAKSGCYTCRIRRKKCDEKRVNELGHCETCVRLRVQCLGFGAKRPEWLRENNNVAGMRTKIKDFLAAQGLIKGHSGSGPRGAEHQPFLRLDEDSTPSSSQSPPTPTLSLSPSEAPRPLQHESAIREHPWIEVDRYNMHNPLRSDSPFARPPHSSHDMAIFPPSYNSSNSLVTWPPSRSPPLGSPALQSSFSATYHVALPEDLYYDSFEEDIGMPFCLYPPPKAGGASDELVTYYVGKVLNVQYLLTDSMHIRNIILPSVLNHGASREAARLLASVHVQRSTYGPNSVALQDKDMVERYEDLRQVLKKSRFTEDDALAAFSIISSFLFDGGVGEWQAWLNVSYDYAKSAFSNGDPRDTLETCAETTRFIIKAAIWFDVLAAITTQEAPRLLEYIRRLFSPLESGVYGPPSQELSMMSVMGCENTVVWVLAEASALSAWKREQLLRGRLSVPDLVERAQQLDSQLDAAPPFTYGQREAEREAERVQSANIFRGATRVYLRSIVSGNYPYVREIAEAVDDTMVLLCVPKMPSTVVRSTVFAFFVCGALTDDARYRKEIADKLSLDANDPTSTVGNSSSIKMLLQSIWSERSKNKALPVEWREVLLRSKMLLV
ncbi:fungal-specific transcription factor domain-containing protein [Mycena pura]|uniref:Fungal-specific transcription factor domain-containing protein n=1 Tax=Mycena pura TaxID=153505 RepID=A0AAD6YRY6_9AGAR|nr:fungal-specific transcription factor domain-containing protein [Mycena pura]